MTNWNIEVVKNPYCKDKYCVSIANVEQLESKRFGVGRMGTDKHGVLSKTEAYELKKYLKSRIDFRKFDCFTEKLEAQLYMHKSQCSI